MRTQRILFLSKKLLKITFLIVEKSFFQLFFNENENEKFFIIFFCFSFFNCSKKNILNYIFNSLFDLFQFIFLPFYTFCLSLNLQIKSKK